MTRPSSIRACLLRVLGDSIEPLTLGAILQTLQLWHVDAHPLRIRRELTQLVAAQQIVRVRRGVYAAHGVGSRQTP